MAGKHHRDRGRRSERRHPSTPREVSVERVDDHTLIVRVPEGVKDEDIAGILLDVQTRTARLPIEAGGVWLTPDEASTMEADSRE